MQRALIAGIILAVLLAFLGVFAVLKRMSFLGDGIAHASLAGIAIGLLASLNPLVIAIFYSVIIAILVYVLEKKTKISVDAIIGILFTASLALGVVLMSFKAGYQPDLISFMFGNILAVSTNDLIIMASISIVVIIFLTIFYKKLSLVAFDKEGAYLSGINVPLFEISFNIFLAVAIVLGVKILGIVLVSALLIIPASIAKLISKSFKSLIAVSIIMGEITVILGLILSYIFDLPSGAVIVLCGTAIFILVASFYRLFMFGGYRR
jgi:ABC-type Mn2+/Zn2+ transport system permease subunit